jgi:hypothetical protein
VQPLLQQKSIRVTYSGFAFGDLGIQHLMRMRHIAIFDLSGRAFFNPILSLKQQDFRMKVIEYKVRAILFCKLVTENFLILTRTERNII